MAIWTIEELDADITTWKAALRAVATGQEYDIGKRRLKRADLPEIRKTLKWLDEERDTLLAGCGSGPFCRAAIPRRD